MLTRVAFGCTLVVQVVRIHGPCDTAHARGCCDVCYPGEGVCTDLQPAVTALGPRDSVA